MRIDGKKSGISPRSRHGPMKKDGKGRPSTSPATKKLPSKYTIVRTREDVNQLEKMRRILKDIYGQSRYNTDSEIYRDLPQLYLIAVKEAHDQQLANEELTAKLVQLEDLRTLICRISEYAKGKK